MTFYIWNLGLYKSKPYEYNKRNWEWDASHQIYTILRCILQHSIQTRTLSHTTMLSPYNVGGSGPGLRLKIARETSANISNPSITRGFFPSQPTDMCRKLDFSTTLNFLLCLLLCLQEVMTSGFGFYDTALSHEASKSRKIHYAITRKILHYPASPPPPNFSENHIYVNGVLITQSAGQILLYD